MESNPNRIVEAQDLLEAMRASNMPGRLVVDYSAETWQLSYVRFCKGLHADHHDIVHFVASVVLAPTRIAFTPQVWASDVVWFPAGEEVVCRLLADIKDDLRESNQTVPDWLVIEGTVVEAFSLEERGRARRHEMGPTDIAVARTTSAYYYVEVHHES